IIDVNCLIVLTRILTRRKMNPHYGVNFVMLISLGLTLAQQCKKKDIVKLETKIVKLCAAVKDEVHKLDNKITDLLERLEATPTVNTGLLDLYACKEGDCIGNDISSHDVDKETCAVLCQQQCQCVGFVYTLHPEASKPCWLKREICDTPTRLLDLYAFKEGDCVGNDISSHDVDKETCAVLCQQQRQCVGFVYTLHPDASKPCWLKREICDTPTSMTNTQTYYKDFGKCV
ncbi:unnamed protein product, partial [Owenia fusiformis]